MMSGVAEAPNATNYALVHFKGDLDVVAAPWARAEVRRRLEKELRFLVLDFRDVSFVDSAGISLLVFAHRAYEARHGRVLLVRVAMRVRRLLALAGILQLFEVLNSLEEAESLIGGAPK